MDKITHNFRYVLAACIAASTGFFLHVTIGRGIAVEYVQAAADEGRLSGVLREPYPGWVVAIATSSAILPAIAFLLLWLLVRDRMPGRSRIVKGFVFGLLLLCLRDESLRLPVMQLVIGNPLDVTAVQSPESWVIYPIMGLLIALISPGRDVAQHGASAESLGRGNFDRTK